MGGTASALKPPPTAAELKKTLQDDNAKFYDIFREMNEKWPFNPEKLSSSVVLGYGRLNLYCWYMKGAYKSKKESTKIATELPNIEYCVDEALVVLDEQKSQINGLIKEDMDDIISTLTAKEDKNFLYILENLPITNDWNVDPGARRWTPYEQLLLSLIMFNNDLYTLVYGEKLGYSGKIANAISHVSRRTTNVYGRQLINAKGHGSGVITLANGTKRYYRMRNPSPLYKPIQQGGSNCKTKIKSNKKRKYSKKQKKQTRRR